MTTWLRRYWNEGDTWFLFELDDEGTVTRHIELEGDDGTPTTAAAVDEWLRALQAGRIREYMTTYGIVAEEPVAPVSAYERIPAEEFEQTWERARRTLEGG